MWHGQITKTHGDTIALYHRPKALACSTESKGCCLTSSSRRHHWIGHETTRLCWRKGSYIFYHIFISFLYVSIIPVAIFALTTSVHRTLPGSQPPPAARADQWLLRHPTASYGILQPTSHALFLRRVNGLARPHVHGKHWFGFHVEG